MKPCALSPLVPQASESRPPHRLCPSSRPGRHLSHEISCWLEKATFLGSFPGVTGNQPQKEAGLRSRGSTRRLGLGAAGGSRFPYLPESKSVEALVGSVTHPVQMVITTVLSWRCPRAASVWGRERPCVFQAQRGGVGAGAEPLSSHPRSDLWIEPAATSS